MSNETTNFTGITSRKGFNLGKQAETGTRITHRFTVQSAAALDLTSTSSTEDLIPSGEIPSDIGGDNLYVIQAFAVITTQVAADTTTPVVTIEDSGDTSSGITISTFADADPVDDVRFSKVADGGALTSVDITSNDLRADVTTAAADTGTAAGDAKVFADVLLVE